MNKIFLIFSLIIIFAGCKQSFIISKIEISGIRHANRKKIEKILESLKGKNLLFSKNRTVLEKIQKLNFVKSIEYEKIIPNILQIKINEFNILGYCTLNNENFVVLENGTLLRSPLKLGIQFDFNNLKDKNLKSYLKFLNTKLELFKNIKRITVKNNYDIMIMKDNFILKVDKNLNGLKNLKYKKIIEKYVDDGIKGFDLRFKNIAILILED